MRKVNVSNSLRKLFSIIMVSIFIIAAMPVDYIRADEPVQDGSKNNPYIVTNFKEFQNGILKQGYIKLANDIDFSEYIYMEVDSSYRGGIDLNGHILNFEKRTDGGRPKKMRRRQGRPAGRLTQPGLIFASRRA